MDVLNILGNKRRRTILQLLTKKDMHISEIARQLKISVPVALKHITLLEDGHLVGRTRVGRSSLVRIRDNAIHIMRQLEDLFNSPDCLSVKKGTNLLEVLKGFQGLSVKKWPGTNKFVVTSIDGQEGYFIYRLNGVFTEKSIDEIFIDEDVVIEFEKLIPVIGKKIEIRTIS